MAFPIGECQKAAIVHGMSSSERQRAALQTVAYDADTTWTTDPGPYQRASMSVYLKARHVNALTSKWSRLSPRTVRDSIPKSKLAHYANYEYNEARELSYSPMVMRFERLYETFDPDEPKEPWMLEDVDDLLIAFLSMTDYDEACTEQHDMLPCRKDFCKKSYESPFLDARTFDEMALRLKLASRNIKKLWNAEYFPCYGWHPQLNTKSLILFKSAASQMFATVKEDVDEFDWLKSFADAEGNLSQIKALTRSFKDQNTWIFKKQSTRSWMEVNSTNSLDLSSPHRRLYSAVLQGSAPASIASFHFDKPIRKSETGTETTEVCYSRTPTVTAEQPSGWHCSDDCRTNVPATSSTPISSVFGCSPPIYQYLPPSSSFISPRLFPNNFIPNASILNFRQTNYFPLVLQNATAPYAQSPLFNYQTSAFSGYRPMVLPQRPQVVLPTTGWFLQPSVKISQHPTVNLLAARPPAPASSYHYRNPNTNRPRAAKASLNLAKEEAVNQDLEHMVAQTVSAVLDDPEPFVPVTGVPSEELELQALEQYAASNTNVFQELERQAAEQYETSENWKGPPKYCETLDLFGGWLHVGRVRLRLSVELGSGNRWTLAW